MTSQLKLADEVYASTEQSLLQTVRACVQVTDFKHGKQWPIMIASYETLRKFADGLAGFCDVLICDEGHRCVQILT